MDTPVTFDPVGLGHRNLAVLTSGPAEQGVSTQPPGAALGVVVQGLTHTSVHTAPHTPQRGHAPFQLPLEDLQIVPPPKFTSLSRT